MTIRVRAASDEGKEGLLQLARSRTRGAGLVRRAQIIVHAMDGLSAPRIAARMELSGDTVRFWLKRLNEGGLAGLGGGALWPAADLLRRRAQHGHPPRPAPTERSGATVRLLDAGPLGRLSERAQHRHAAQPHQRDPAR
ncbi:helix-turn-helix domain-containing protein [Azospirillum sp. YIM B02556]|uniref:Helix-turn-helix domain-containing protein n=1 Tax=Azospirillum endophyticum TaxID=2800326 RepID=A0ABS1FIB4_9PROT|nr:helix-turn-helix domain-containing protein [Azospirillum endophyticum]